MNVFKYVLASAVLSLALLRFYPAAGEADLVVSAKDGRCTGVVVAFVGGKVVLETVVQDEPEVVFVY